MEYSIINNIAFTDDINIIKDKYEVDDNILVKKINFPSEEDAQEYLKDIAKVYEENIITYYQVSLTNFSNSNIGLELNDKVLSSIKNYFEFIDSIIDRFSNQKSNKKGCNHCSSNINKDVFKDKLFHNLNRFNELHKDLYDKYYLSDNISEIFEEAEVKSLFSEKMKLIECPICDSDKFLLTETDEDKISKLFSSIDNSIQKYIDAKQAEMIKNGFETKILFLKH